MIVRIEYQNTISAIKTKYKGKEKSHYIRFVVDEYSIQSALERVRDNKWVVALDYEGDISYLNNVKYDVNDKPVIIFKQLDEISELTIKSIMRRIPLWVRVAIKTPEDFNNMRVIFDLSKKYPNIRFCGGNFLRLGGCNVGCIGREDIPRKVAESKIDYYTKGCNCIIKTLNIEDIEGYEFIYSSEEDKLKSIKDEKVDSKRVVKSLRDLL